MSVTKVPKDESRDNRIYNKALERPVKEKSFLLEAGQGRNINGNVFALLKQIRSDTRFDDYSISLVLIPEKQDEGRRRLRKYGIENVDIVSFGGDEYRVALAVCKYLITDNSFPAYFWKRPDQVYLNTWHGTPLKALGRTDLANAISIANVQANMAKADWLLHPNSFTRDIMMRDYMMERVYSHRVVVMDYPRNDALYRAEFIDEIIVRYGIGPGGRRAIAYMPTWRGTGRDADVDQQLKETEAIIAEMSKGLAEDELLFVNLHFLIGSRLDLSAYDNVLAFPPEYETYDFLACCDVLITDYSSVCIDFAGTGREIVLFIYDYEQYKRDKGFYLDVTELPFPKARSMSELMSALHDGRKKRGDGDEPLYELDPALASEDRGDSCRRVIDLIMGNTGDGSDAPKVEYYSSTDYAAPVIAYFENINRDDSREMISRLQEKHPDPAERPVIMFPNVMKDETIETLRMLDSDTDFVRISGRMYCSNNEIRLLKIHNRTGLFAREAERIYRREAMRQIGQFKASEIRVMQCNNKDRLRMLDLLKTGNR